ncbi:hypothetical protein C8R47DRAFT_1212452 [Mycena vitilis]|nr:hypothetical protein C8R47DRAFT_1212452 [Mycena vitilis]
MYRLGSDATIFESDGVFYVYGVGEDGKWLIPALYRFSGRFSSVEDFIEYSDWNRMEPLTFHDDLNPAPVSLAPTKPTMQQNRLLKTGNVFRAAAERPYQKRTIWDICSPKDTWGHHPRVLRPRHRRGECPHLAERALKEWPRIPDAQLPEPWSSSWECWDHVAYWYTQPGSYFSGHEATLYEYHGVAGLTPVMFMPDGQDRGPVILSAGEDYYFFNHEMDEWLKKFDGTYASAEDFIQNGDWNKMEFVKYVWHPRAS